MKTIFHIDVNSAFLSWTAAHYLQNGGDVDLRKIPSAIGGDEKNRHGIILAKSTPAKKQGVITGEPIFQALQKCPELKIVPPDRELYIQAGNALLDLLLEFSPRVQRFSIDEAFMDSSDSDIPPILLANIVKDRIEKELGFTVNIGISSNKLLAKMASDFQKPNKIHTLYPEEIESKMWKLPVQELFMVGRKTKKKLNARGIFTIGDLANQDKEYMISWLKKHGEIIWNYANGIDRSEVKISDEPIKSIGNSTTVSFDVDNEKEANLILLALCEKVGARIRDEKMRGYVVQVGLKDSEFNYKTRQITLLSPTNSTNVIFQTAKEIFAEMWENNPIRLFSVSITKLVEDEEFQLSFFTKYDENDDKLNNAVDKIRKTKGNDSLKRASFLNSSIKHMIGGVDVEGNFPNMTDKL